MKVLVLGGAGAVCSEATKDLSFTSDFSEITIGEIDIEKAKALASELNDSRISIIKVNAENIEELTSLMKDYDIVVNGLPFKYDEKVTEAAIAAKVNGLDVSGLQDLEKHDEEAKKAGVIYVPGVGATPGVTNLLVKYAANNLDQVDEIQISHAAYRCLAPSLGLLDTTLWEYDPTVEDRCYYENGKYIYVTPFSGEKTIEFPEPIGAQKTYYIPHPELKTLPKSIKGVRKIEVRGTWPPKTMQIIKALYNFGFYKDDNVKIKGSLMKRRDFLYSYIREYLIQAPEAKETEIWGYSLDVEVTGVKNRRFMKFKFLTSHPPMEKWGGTSAYAKNVGIPLSIGAQMLAKITSKETSLKGILPPEQVFNPELFFIELAKRGIKVHIKIEGEYVF
ncbi:saccharopine dehydrogenase NADP-binding domain-containing protein [Candidatus Bathyarchaeota archaeon]|nr:saccharopine dehydrogenase NADP-binding domain-containing protein [Candidatus Bathyarchaeota archaeon]